MNITSKNGLAMLKEKNVETKDYTVVFVKTDGTEQAMTLERFRLSDLNNFLTIAQKDEDVIKLEVFETTKTTAISIRPIHCWDIVHKEFEPKHNRTSYLRTRNIR